MPRPLSRVALVLVLAATSLLGALIAPPQARGTEQGLAAAETVLFSVGSIGHWMFPQPPGALVVDCTYPFDLSSNRHMMIQSPAVFPAGILASQSVAIGYELEARRPDGSFVYYTGIENFGTATTSAPFSAPPADFQFPDLGSSFVAIAQISWLGANTGQVDLLYTQYLAGTDACKPALAADLGLDSAEGIVGASIPFFIDRFPSDPHVGIYFDRDKIGSVATDEHGSASGSFVVPAAPMGPHTVRFYRYGRNATETFTIKPRIKLIPSTNLTRGQTVNVSLRGYHAHETVYIRWKKGSSFVQINHVTTSSTGSANINIHVPSFAVIGTNSVRGDGAYGHAQTNAVTVIGSSSSGSVSNASPTPAKTATLKPTATVIPATPTPQATASGQPTEPESTATSQATEPIATATAAEALATSTAEPSATATPEIEPTESNPTATPPAEETALPTETAVPPS
jgi:hypothetical protein